MVPRRSQIGHTSGRRLSQTERKKWTAGGANRLQVAQQGAQAITHTKQPNVANRFRKGGAKGHE